MDEVTIRKWVTSSTADDCCVGNFDVCASAMGDFEYAYSNRDLIFSVDSWENGSVGSSKFDEFLCKRWDEAQQAGHFRYKLEELDTKILDGKYHFVAQLNVKRASDRRKPQHIASVSQPFNHEDFNFTKVVDHEILFEIRKIDGSPSQHGQENAVVDKSAKDNVKTSHKMLINVSPLEYGNSLFVPYVYSCFPQVLTLESICMAIELVLCSSNKGFRAGFNSLCANASVNHLHFHVYYLSFELPVETIATRNVAGDCYEIVSYPAPGFAFQLINNDISSLGKSIFTVVNYLQSNNIAHNLFITRGTKFDSQDKKYDAIRVYLWTRRSEIGIKDDTAFNIACCELSGHLPIKNFDAFHSISEEVVVDTLKDACESTFNEVLPKVKQLLSTT
ncbi:hypothetical protein CHUAL_003214 [Chamberlinius hualienensis]